MNTFNGYGLKHKFICVSQSSNLLPAYALLHNFVAQSTVSYTAKYRNFYLNPHSDLALLVASLIFIELYLSFWAGMNMIFF